MSEPTEFANPLERSLAEAAESPAARPAFYRELLASRVLIIPAEFPDLVDGKLREGQSLKLVAMEHDGKAYVPFFTCADRMPPGSQSLEIEASALFAMTKGSPLVLNPGASHGKEFLPGEVEDMLSGKLFQPQAQYVVEKPEQVIIGQPSERPEALLAELARFFEKTPGVVSAWLAWYHQPSREEKPGYLLAIETDAGVDFRALSGNVGLVIKTTDHGDNYVDVIQYSQDTLSGYFTKQAPFFKRRKAGFWARLFGR